MSDRLRRRNKTVMVSLFGLVFGMVGVSFAAVPLYDLFCRVTGYGGTTQVAEGYSTEILDREIQVRFVARADAALPWEFTSETGRMTVRVGEPNLAYYRVENTSDRPVTGMAVYNVSPFQVGAYFQKMECFCFGEQTLQPGETMELPVYFYIDAAIADERTLDDVTSVTLSYTFYPTESEELDDAVEGYYQSVEQSASATAPEPRT
ncbi:cytochrome c oxidase assembly protein [Fodinicurvata sp. EGI_FJ10296]|uniref:cytochrome c oxidase assembly protein n=1 Tax=Fodinicurvata sp. EGI_FJ10296 TaxID=3231908 RepID=UPI0034518850